MELFTAAQMKEIDRIAIQERGIPSDVLMERAARALVDEVLKLPVPRPGKTRGMVWVTTDGNQPSEEEQAAFWASRKRRAVIFCGPGNNGSDGVAAARFLLEQGWEVKCVLVGCRESMTASSCGVRASATMSPCFSGPSTLHAVWPSRAVWCCMRSLP